VRREELMGVTRMKHITPLRQGESGQQQEQVMDTSKKSFRIAVVLSVIWELCLLAIAAENSSPSPFDDVYSLQTHIFITYMAIGSLPLVLLWGWKWIRTGR